MDYFDLKREIEINFGKKIIDRPDCEALSKSIYEKTKYIESYNTLRRFFQLAGLKSTTSIANKTLDILSNYCGHQFYDEFKNRNSKNLKSIHLYKLQLELQQKDKFTLKYIQNCLEQTDDEEQLYILVNYITLLAFKRKDTDFLKQIFQVKRIFNGNHYLRVDLYYLIQTIGVQVRDNPEISHELWKYWASDIQARFYYFELFVDMDTLINKHYIAIEYYQKQSSTNQEIVFSNSLLGWRALLIGDLKLAKKYLIVIQSIDLKNDIHPIPVARALNFKLLNEFKETGTVSLNLIAEVDFFKTYFLADINPFFEQWICEGLVLVKEYKKALIFIKDSQNKTKINPSFYLNGANERLKILSVYCMKKLGKTRGIKKIISEIDLNQLDSFSNNYDSVFHNAFLKADENIFN